MSNLSDLLPAGAAAKQLTFTDSGSGISSKAPVVLNSDGTVSAISSSASSVGSPDQFTPTTAYGGGGPQSVCYDTTNDVFIIAFKDANNSNALSVIAATLSGTNFTFGAVVAVGFPANTDTYDIVFDSLRNCFVVVCQEHSNLKCYTGTVSGTTITVNSGSALVVSSATYGLVKAVFDSTNNKTLLFCRDSSSKGQCFAISVDVSYAPSTSAAYNFSGTDNVDNSFIALRGVHDPDQGVVLLSYRGPSVVGYLSLVDCSGATPTGTLLTNSAWSSSGFGGGDIGYDTVNNKCVITVYDANNSNYLSYQVVTIDSSSTATFETKVTQSAANSQYPDMQYTDYDPTAAVTVCSYTSNNLGTYAQKATVSGTTLTLDSTLLEIVNSTLIAKQQGVVYDPDTSQFVMAYYNYDGTDEGYAKTFKVATTNLSAQAFVGVADSAISASAAGSIIVQGGTVTGPTADVTIAESLSSAFLYAQDASADPVGSKASATGSDNFLIAFEINDGAANGALAQAATVTSGNINYGSSAAIGGASTTVYHYSIAYDSTNDKFVVFWQNYSTGYIYGAVVTLTGNSISYGAEAAVYSAAGQTAYGAFASTYDPDTDRVILGVCDNGDSYAYSVVIKLGTTTIDTVGTAQKIDSASATVGYAKKLDLCYDTTEDKVIATYVYTGGGGSYYLRVAAGTVAGGVSNSTTWGSSSVVYSGDATYPSIAYNATDQRVVVVYKQVADAKGYSSVATVSGTTVTANTPSVFYDPTSTGGWTLYYTSLAHDAYVNQMVIYMRASQGDAVYGAIDTGTNSMTWSTPPLNVSADAYNPSQVVFNASTNQTILSGAGTTKATAESYIYTVPGTVAGQPLTIGTKYYVTTTGTFRSSADTPSVNAGIAISTTSLLLNGDS